MLSYLVLIVLTLCGTTSSRLVWSDSQSIEMGNFTYYTLSHPGTFKLVLVSHEGDADLYVSDRHKRVDYTNYDLQSTTYGKDEIEIEQEMRRPVYISVYAHPYYLASRYSLHVFEVKRVKSDYYSEYIQHDSHYQDFVDSPDQTSSHRESIHDHDSAASSLTDDDEQDTQGESFIVSLLLHLLEFILDALL